MKSKPTARKKTAPAKKSAAKKKSSRKAVGAKPTRRKTAPKTATQERRRPTDTVFVEARPEKKVTGQLAGDLQGLSQSEGPDSESVGELLEEGNPFEANVISGVQQAEDADEKEVRTHEVPEDDVPQEYLDEK
jgi:hypothetical protein